MFTRLSLLLSLAVLPALAAHGETGLPLPQGYYIAEGESCGSATEANTALLHENGLNTPEMLCAFDLVSEVEPALYSYAGICAHPEQREDYLAEGRIKILSSSGFEINDGLVQGRYIHCPAEDLPPPLGN